MGRRGLPLFVAQLVFAGEYAAQSAPIANSDNKNNGNRALSEAAFMTGLQRNAYNGWENKANNGPQSLNMIRIKI